MSAWDDDRLMQLLADEATEGLCGSDADVLGILLAEHPGFNPAALEIAASAATLVWLEAAPGAPPAHLVARLRADAGRVWQPERVRAVGRRRDAGWLVAAALLVLAALAWWPRSTSPQGASLEARYAAFLARTPDAVRAAWSPQVERYAQVSGEVVWSDAAQSGFMRFEGLPPTAPDAQYQLWIVAPHRDRHPVDGGVFSVRDEGGAAIVPIDAALRVEEPTAFAITVEKQGGVVVSEGPLLIVAAVPG